MARRGRRRKDGLVTPERRYRLDKTTEFPPSLVDKVWPRILEDLRPLPRDQRRAKVKVWRLLAGDPRFKKGGGRPTHRCNAG